jgi:tRNA pseudouridine65 synthase
VHKEYLAVVRGWAPERGRIDRAIRCEESGQLQDAVTEFERVAVAEFPVPIDRYPATRISLVRVRPETGRTHQIRRHLRGINHPILGDSEHGDGPINRFAREHLGAHRLLLHASRLEFTHPVSGEAMSVVAPLPRELAEIFARVGWVV